MTASEKIWYIPMVGLLYLFVCLLYKRQYLIDPHTGIKTSKTLYLGFIIQICSMIGLGLLIA